MRFVTPRSGGSNPPTCSTRQTPSSGTSVARDALGVAATDLRPRPVGLAAKLTLGAVPVVLVAAGLVRLRDLPRTLRDLLLGRLLRLLLRHSRPPRSGLRRLFSRSAVGKTGHVESVGEWDAESRSSSPSSSQPRHRSCGC